MKLTSAIITGAAQGIGLAVAKRLGSAGQPVVIAGRTKAKIEAAEDLLDREGIKVAGVQADVTREEDIVRMVRVALEQFGGIQALVNNAGVYQQRFLFDITSEFWETTMAINLRSAVLASKEVARHMNERGRIVNISSMSGLICEPGYAAYNASKAGLISLTKSLAVDLADRGIIVNCVAPGWIRTPMTEDYLARVTPEQMRGINLLGRAGTPEEVAEVVAFLARPDVTFLTGQTIFIDGGQTIMTQLPE